MNKLFASFLLITTATTYTAAPYHARVPHRQFALQADTSFKAIAEYPPLAYTPEEKDRIKHATLRTGIITGLLSAGAIKVIADESGLLACLVGGVTFGSLCAWGACSIAKDRTRKAEFDRLRGPAEYYALQPTVGAVCSLEDPQRLDPLKRQLPTILPIFDRYKLVTVQQNIVAAGTFLDTYALPVLERVSRIHGGLGNLQDHAQRDYTKLCAAHGALLRDSDYGLQAVQYNAAIKAKEERDLLAAQTTATHANAAANRAVAAERRQAADLRTAQTVHEWTNTLQDIFGK